MSPYQFGTHDLELFASIKRIHRQLIQERVQKINHLPHKWHPNDGKPVLGLNEDDDRKEKPYIVLRNVTYIHALLRDIEIPRDFKCDLGSIPWLFQVIPGMKPTDPGCRHYLVHDWSYSHLLADRLILDAILCSGLENDGWSWWKSRAVYCGVRAGGWKPYSRYQQIAKRIGQQHGPPD